MASIQRYPKKSLLLCDSTESAFDSFEILSIIPRTDFLFLESVCPFKIPSYRITVLDQPEIPTIRSFIIASLPRISGKLLPTVRLSMRILPGQFPFQLLFVDLIPVTLHQW